MRDGSTRRRSTSPQQRTGTPERVQVHDWRRHGRLDDLRAFAEGANRLTWSRGLLHALLEELHISDDFDVHVGRVGRVPASQCPRLLAIALLLRHSWCPRDLSRTATRLGLLRPHASTADPITPESLSSRDRGHRRRERTSASLSKPRTSHR